MTEQNAEVLYLPTRELTPEQHDYWLQQLEVAERAVEYAKRMLGTLAIERGLQ